MSDSPTPEVQPTPEPIAPAGAPVAVVEPPVPEAAAPAPEAVPAPPPAAPPAEPRSHKAVQVPVWVLIVVTVVVVGLGAFFVGRETAPDAGASGPATLAEAVEMTAAGEMEVGDFDFRSLLQALSQNEDLDLGVLGDLILGQGGRR